MGSNSSVSTSDHRMQGSRMNRMRSHITNVINQTKVGKYTVETALNKYRVCYDNVVIEGAIYKQWVVHHWYRPTPDAVGIAALVSCDVARYSIIYMRLDDLGNGGCHHNGYLFDVECGDINYTVISPNGTVAHAGQERLYVWLPNELEESIALEAEHMFEDVLKMEFITNNKLRILSGCGDQTYWSIPKSCNGFLECITSSYLEI